MKSKDIDIEFWEKEVRVLVQWNFKVAWSRTCNFWENENK
jgi:hypothetical protein